MNSRVEAIRYKKAIDDAAQETAVAVINEGQFLDKEAFDAWLEKLRTREEFQEEGKDWITDYFNALRARLRMHVLVMPNEAAEASLINLAHYKPFNELENDEPICPISYQKLGKGNSAVGVPLSTGRLYDAESIARWVLVENKKIDPMSREPLTRGDLKRIEQYRPLVQNRPAPGVSSPGRLLLVFGLSMLAFLGGAALGILLGGLVGTLIAGPAGFVPGMFVGAGALSVSGVAAVLKVNNWLHRREANRHARQQEAVDLEPGGGNYVRLDEINPPSPRSQHDQRVDHHVEMKRRNSASGAYSLFHNEEDKQEKKVADDSKLNSVNRRVR